MKNAALIVTLCAAALFLESCDGLLTEEELLEEEGKIVDKKYVGEWIRMDTGESWYITRESISVNKGYPSTTIPSMTKESDRVIRVSDGSRIYYLYASRPATSSFTGRITGNASRAIGSGIGGIRVAITNLKDKTSTATTVTGNDGGFTAEETIAGDEYEIKAEGQTTTVMPNVDGDDIGTIAITDGVNFKTSLRPGSSSLDLDRLYADFNSYDLEIEIENTGDEDCFAATYSLACDRALILMSGSTSGVLGTIEPGVKKTVSLTVACQPIQAEYEFKRINITINDTINQKSWDDSVSIKFNKKPVDFFIRSNSRISGVIITPNAKAYHFNSYSQAEVKVPWSSRDYLVVFSGATADTEAVYSLGVNQVPEENFDGFMEPGKYEPNNTEDAAPVLSADDTIMAYLHKNDIDYYRINLGSSTPEIKPVYVTSSALKELEGNDDGKANPRETLYWDILMKNTTNSDLNIASATLSTTSGYVTVNQGRATVGTIGAGYYKSLTTDNDSYSSYYQLFNLEEKLPNAFRFTVAPNCPVGAELPLTVTFTDSWGNAWRDTVTVVVE